ncbi:MAG: short-chain dehydrogenase/reductase [Thalassobaculales bacterium]
MTSLSGKTAIVTGASRGIGHAIALELARQGADLVLAARSADRLEVLAADIRALGRRATVHAADLRQPEAPGRLIAAAGEFDILVNNAGSTKRGDFLALGEEDWAEGFALKFFGYVRCARAAWPVLAGRRGVILNIVGAGGRTPSAEFTIGGSVNAGLLNFTKALADRGRGDGVRVLALNPGPVRTDRLMVRVEAVAKARGLDRDAAIAVLEKEQQVTRFGTVEDIAGIAAFLVGPRADYMHGAIVDADGGATKGL